MDNALVTIMTALLKHQIKKLIGEDTLQVLGEELSEIGGDKLNLWLSKKSITDDIEKSAKVASENFRGKVQDDEIEQWMVMLPIHNLPEVSSAINELETSPDERKLEAALQETISLNWKRLSKEQVDRAVHAYLSCLREALLPIEKQTLLIIGRSVLRTEEKVNLLINWFDEYIVKAKFSNRAINIKQDASKDIQFNRETIHNVNAFFDFDIEAYITEIDRLNADANISKYYVPLDGWLETENGQKIPISLDDFFYDKWLKEIKGHLAILGDYGTGKSWFCLRISKYLIDKFRADPDNNPLPLLITFKQYKLNMDIAELIQKDLFESYGVNIKNNFQLRALLRSGKVLPILDGMDEMAKEIGTHTALVMFSRLGMAREIPKAIISCRTHYFHSGSEEREILGSEDSKRLLDNFARFTVIHIRLFGTVQKI